MSWTFSLISGNKELSSAFTTVVDSTPTYSPPSHRVLIVDGFVEEGRSLRLSLQRHGFHTIHSPSSSEALELVEKKRFDTLLLDPMSPGIAANELIATIYARHRLLPALAVEVAPFVRTDLRVE